MKNYKNEEFFSSEKFPEIIKELRVLKEETAHTSIYFKPEIIISYLKNHSLKTEWIDANPVLASLMVSECFATVQTQLFFEFYRGNTTYVRSYEAYIRQMFIKA